MPRLYTSYSQSQDSLLSDLSYKGDKMEISDTDIKLLKRKETKTKRGWLLKKQFCALLFHKVAIRCYQIQHSAQMGKTDY